MSVGVGQRLRFRGMAVRVGVLVLATSLATALAISWVSVGSLEGFLRGRIDQNFPELLEASHGKLDLWFRQRSLDFEVFARSPILRSARTDRRSQAEAERYLSYLLENFNQYESLSILGDSGESWLTVGKPVEIPEVLGLELIHIEHPTVTGLHQLGPNRRQIVAVRIGDEEGPRQVLVGVMARAALEAPIVAPDIFGSTVALVDKQGEVVAGILPVGRVESDASGSVSVIEGPHGGRFVVASRPLGRFDWNLVIAQDYGMALAPVTDTVQRTMMTNLMLVLISSGLALWAVAWRMQPILRLADGAKRLAEGDADVRVPEEGSSDEVAQLSRAFNEMAERLDLNRQELEARNQELVRANEVLEQLSITDGLTKLHNHRHFQDQFAREARRAERTGDSMCLVLIDIDDFKKLNDRLGHAAGDRVLENVAQLMNSLTRGTDYLARYGGEEFAMILPKTELEGAVALAEKMRLGISRLEVPVLGVDDWVRVTASFGVAIHEHSTSKTFEAADKALYEAKGSGKDCVFAAAESTDSGEDAD